MLQYSYPIRLTPIWRKTMRQFSERFSSCRTQQEYTQVGIRIFRFFRMEGSNRFPVWKRCKVKNWRLYRTRLQEPENGAGEAMQPAKIGFSKKKSTILPTKYSAFLVENSGIEPLTSCVQSRRSPSWANSPFVENWLQNTEHSPSVFCFQLCQSLKSKQG